MSTHRRVERLYKKNRIKAAVPGADWYWRLDEYHSWALSDRKRRGYSISGIPITDTWWQQRYFSAHFISLLPLNLMIRPAGWTVTAQRAPAERLTPLSRRSIDSGWVYAAPTSAPRLPFVTCSAGKLKRSFIQLTRPRLEGKEQLDPTR